MKSSAPKKCDLPLKRLDEALLIYGARRYMVLTEECFIEYALRRALTRQQLMQDHHVPHNVVHTSFAYYEKRYAAEIDAVKRTHYSTAMRSNRRGVREQPAVTLDAAALRTAVERGLSIRAIAAMFNTTAWFIRANMRHHGIASAGHLPYSMQCADEHYLEQLEQFAPGLLDAARSYQDNPAPYYEKLYVAFMAITELRWFVKERTWAYKGLRATGQLPASHLCWSDNRFEILLSQALLARGIHHQREYALSGGCRADFAFPEQHVLVEIDGEYHTADPATRVRDRRKTQWARRHGFKVLRFTTRDVQRRTPWVIEQICNSFPAR